MVAPLPESAVGSAKPVEGTGFWREMFPESRSRRCRNSFQIPGPASGRCRVLHSRNRPGKPGCGVVPKPVRRFREPACRFPLGKVVFMRQFVFLRPPGPGAFVRFAERKAPDSNDTMQIELSDARLCAPWRIVFAAATDLDPWLPAWAHAFGPEVHCLRLLGTSWVWESHVHDAPSRRWEGEWSDPPWWRRLPGAPPTMPPWWAVAPDEALPLAQVLNPPRKTVDFAAIDSLDQRGLLVETEPVRYQIRIPIAPTV